MESDSDLDCDLPPGWELSTLNGKPHYLNHISNTSHFEHPLKKSNRLVNLRSDEKFIQKFDAFSTAEKVLKNKDCSTEIAVIVGGCSGVGLEIVYYLASLNCQLILGCPDVARCTQDICRRIDVSTFHRLIVILPLDLSSLRSVKEFCKSVLGRGSMISMVVLSAAVMCPPYTITEDGFESSFQINCLSQFYIVMTLVQSFKLDDSECRIVFLACESHRLINSFELSDLMPSILDYDGYNAYALSNLLKIIIAKELPKRIKQCQIKNKICIFVCHPGNMINNTRINRYSPKLSILFWLCGAFTKNLSQAASTPLFCLTSLSIKKFNGSYLNNGCLCEPSKLACDKIIRNLIWDYLYNLFLKL